MRSWGFLQVAGVGLRVGLSTGLSARLCVGLGVALFALPSCNFRRDKTTALQTNGRLSFSLVQRAVLGPRCMSCHNSPTSPKGVDLTTYQATMKTVTAGDPEKSSLYDSIQSGRMPKGAPRLPQDEIDLVAAWILAGAPEVGAEPPPKEAPPPPPEPSWTWISTQVLQKRCTGCHNGLHPDTELDLRSYEAAIDFSKFGIRAIEPGEPENSNLYLSLADQSMPPEGPPVEGAELEAIRQWIQLGAPRE